MAQSPGQPRSPEQAILMMRIIGISLGTGVTLFAVVSWFFHQQDGTPASGFDPSLAFNGYLVLFLLSAIGALFVWRTRVGPVIERPAQETEWRPRASSIQAGVIITWGILEGGALFGEVVYFLTGHPVAGILGVALIWIGVGLTWPTREWL